jgi:hypothetical protein
MPMKDAISPKASLAPDDRSWLEGLRLRIVEKLGNTSAETGFPGILAAYRLEGGITLISSIEDGQGASGSAATAGGATVASGATATGNARATTDAAAATVVQAPKAGPSSSASSGGTAPRSGHRRFRDADTSAWSVPRPQAASR